MISARIICAYDAEEFAHELERLLSAEGFPAKVCVGRASEYMIQESQARREAVLLVWSRDGVAQHYMRQWLERTVQGKLIEISRAGAAPPTIDRREDPIDFSQWKGTRAGTAWRLLEERLRGAARACDPPPKPPVRAAMTMTAAGAAALAVAGGLRIANSGEHVTAYAPPPPTPDDVATERLAQRIVLASVDEIPSGGPAPVDLVEPNSVDTPRFGPLAPRLRQIEVPQINLSRETRLVNSMIYRDPSLFERITDMAHTGIREISSTITGDNGE